MTRTRYSSFTVGLLIIGIAIACVAAWIAAMTTAFGADPVHDLKTAAVMSMLYASLALVPASLITLRWPIIGAAISGMIALFCAICILASSVAVLFLVLAIAESAIATAVKHQSEKPAGGLSIWTG